MRLLRTNTAVIVTVGPFYDKTDGVTIEGSLTITNERITLTADTDEGSAPTLILDNITGATSGTANDLNYITNTDAGLMQIELSAANVNRLGRMFLTITDAANHVPVFHEFMVVNAALYDAFFASSGGAIPNAVAGASGGVFIAGTNAATTVTTALTTTFTGNLTGSVASVSGAVGSVTGMTASDVGAIKAKTDNLPTDPADQSLIIAATDAIVADTEDIQARLPAALTAGGNIKADALALSGDTTAADNAEAFFDGTGYAGTNNVIPLVTTVTNLTNAPTSGDLTATMKTSVTTAATAATPTATAVTGAVGSVTGNVGGNVVGSVASVTAGVTLAASAVQAIWDALTSALTTAGSIGKLLVDNINATISSRLAAADITLSSGKVTVGTNDDKTGYRLSATGVDDVLDEVVEGAVTLRQSIRLDNAANAGKASGMGTTSVAIRDIGDTKDRITATVDADGNRSAVTTDVT